VFAAFSEDIGIDIETALKISSSFGGGMGKLREVCGAVTGMFMVAGMKYGYTDPNDRLTKTEHYKRIHSIGLNFKEKNGSLICRDLLGLDKETDTYIPEPRTTDYYKRRPCVELVGEAADMIYEFMNKKGD
jgi:C_GCAxxG_C_C family probable redox protein